MFSIPLPPDDSSIQEALTSLRIKLSDWVAAMATVQDALVRGIAEGYSTPVSAHSRGTTEATEVEQAANADASVAVCQSSQGQDDALTGDAGPDVLRSNAQSATGENPPAVADNDDALLASLDEKTANAIRVLRRLDPGRKCVRELVEEYRQSGRGQDRSSSSATKKMVWWKRRQA